jgi:hypothetical protein
MSIREELQGLHWSPGASMGKSKAGNDLYEKIYKQIFHYRSDHYYVLVYLEGKECMNFQ